MRTRLVQPEWLDTLDAADSRARRARADLVRVHLLMGHRLSLPGILSHVLDGLPSEPHVIELGAGDGALLHTLAPGLARHHPRLRLTLLDRSRTVTAAAAGFSTPGWQVEASVADVFDWIGSDASADLVFCSLFLHHFEDTELRRLLAGIALKTGAFVACEPRRSGLGLAASHLLGLAGCTAVTRHDAVVSVRAGFSGNELSRHWPHSATHPWTLEERALAPFSHLFVALRA